MGSAVFSRPLAFPGQSAGQQRFRPQGSGAARPTGLVSALLHSSGPRENSYDFRPETFRVEDWGTKKRDRPKMNRQSVL